MERPHAPPAHREGPDPWVVGGLMLLALLSVGAILIYRSAPSSLAEARTESWFAARPNAFGANLARGRERLDRAYEEALAGNDSATITLDSVAAEHGWRAATLASDARQREEALALWAEATLHRAETLRVMGTGVGLRPDDNATLERALQLAIQVDSIGPRPTFRARADSLRVALERQLRLGPLEWLPR